MTRQEKTLPSAQYPAPSSKEGSGIRVGKTLTFPLHEWRDGILTFLDGIVHQQPIVLSFPEIAIGRARLRLHQQGRYFVAYGDRIAVPPNDTQKSVRDRMVRSDDDQSNVERALRYFIEEPAILLFRIDFPHNGVYWLWKTSAQTVCASLLNLPRMVVF